MSRGSKFVCPRKKKIFRSVVEAGFSRMEKFFQDPIHLMSVGMSSEETSITISVVIYWLLLATASVAYSIKPKNEDRKCSKSRLIASSCYT